MAVMVPTVLLVTVVQARANRRAAQDLAVRVAAAAQQAAMQQARFHEVRAELDAVIRPLGGMQGPFTGHMAGAYRLGAVVGRGGYGEVYSALTAGGDAAAVKVLRTTWLTDDEALARFRRETDIARQLSSPHLVQYLGAGTLAAGEPYRAIVKRIIDGTF